MISNFLSHAGFNRSVCEELADRLSSSGWQVWVTSKMISRLSRLADMLNTIWIHRKEYQIAQIDVFSGAAFLWAEACCGLLSLLNKPFVITLHGGNLPDFAQRWPKRVTRLLNSASLVTAPSSYLLTKMLPYCQKNFRLLPNALEISAYPFRLRNQPGPRIIWLRAFHKIYNPELAPKILVQLLPDFPGVSLIMIGPDKGDGSLQATQHIAQSLGVLDHIEFPGPVPKANVPHWLNQGDIFINTTNVDNTPVSVIEAMACGLCVVSTDVGGIPFLLDHEHDALLVPPNTPDRFAQAIQQILNSPELAAQLSRNAREKASQWGWKIIFPKWESLLLKIINA